jgi:hypothetical protein
LNKDVAPMSWQMLWPVRPNRQIARLLPLLLLLTPPVWSQAPITPTETTTAQLSATSDELKEIDLARESMRKAFMTQKYDRVIQIHGELLAKYPSARVNPYYVSMAQTRLAEMRAAQQGNQGFRRLATAPPQLSADSPSLSNTGPTETPAAGAPAQTPPPTPGAAQPPPPQPEPNAGQQIPPPAGALPQPAPPAPAATPETSDGRLIPAGTATPEPPPPAAAVTPANEPKKPGERQVATLMTPAPPSPVVTLPSAEPSAEPVAEHTMRRTLLQVLSVIAGLVLVSLLLFVMRRRPAAVSAPADVAPWAPETPSPLATPAERRSEPPAPAPAPAAAVAAEEKTESFQTEEAPETQPASSFSFEDDDFFAPMQSPPLDHQEPTVIDQSQSDSGFSFDEDIFSTPTVAQQPTPAPKVETQLDEQTAIDLPLFDLPTAHEQAPGLIHFEAAQAEPTPVASPTLPEKSDWLADSPFAKILDNIPEPEAEELTPPYVEPVSIEAPHQHHDDVWNARPATDDTPLNLDDLPSAPTGHGPSIVERDVISLETDSGELPAFDEPQAEVAPAGSWPGTDSPQQQLPAMPDDSMSPERAATQQAPLSSTPLTPAYGSGDIGSEVTHTSWDESYERTGELSQPGFMADLPAAAEEPSPIQAFHPDETVRIDLAEELHGEVTQMSGVAGEATISASGVRIKPPDDETLLTDSQETPEAAPEVTVGNDLFEREFRQGQLDFEEGNWGGAVHHLSIAAALRPDAQEVKEHLREARRRRKEDA